MSIKGVLSDMQIDSVKTIHFCFAEIGKINDNLELYLARSSRLIIQVDIKKCKKENTFRNEYLMIVVFYIQISFRAGENDFRARS